MRPPDHLRPERIDPLFPSLGGQFAVLFRTRGDGATEVTPLLHVVQIDGGKE